MLHELSITHCTNGTSIMSPFTDSFIAAKITMSHIKVSYMISYGLGPYFLEKTMGDILNIPDTFYTIHFDETTTVQLKKQLDKLSQILFRQPPWSKGKFSESIGFWPYIFWNCSKWTFENSTGIKLASEVFAVIIITWSKCQQSN